MPNPLLPGLQLQPLPYHDRLPLRDPATLEMVVIHCTELPDLATAREYGERVLYDSGAGNSGHFYIDRDPQQVVLMCGSGVTACHLLLAMETAGLSGARIYADSWSGWVSDSSRPVATGA